MACRFFGADLIPKMQAYEDKELANIEAEQVSHPLDEYQPGSERLERLYAAIEEAKRFQYPKDLSFNF